MPYDLVGRPVAEALVQELSERVSRLRERGVIPALAVVRVGDNGNDSAYERAACKRCECVGIAVELTTLSDACTPVEFEQVLVSYAANEKIHGVLVLRPLPPQLSNCATEKLIAARQDVDGITDASALAVLRGTGEGFAPCTPEAVLALLSYYEVPLDGAHVVVIGRSAVVGRPLAQLLVARNATVTLCHSHTVDLPELCAAADVVIAAAGSPGLLHASWLREGAVVVDVGVTWDEKSQRLVGDFVWDSEQTTELRVTPVPRGVGAVTTAILAQHVVEAAERSC